MHKFETKLRRCCVTKSELTLNFRGLCPKKYAGLKKVHHRGRLKIWAMLFCQFRDFDQIDEVLARFFYKDDHLHSFLLYMYVEFPFSVVHKWESLFYIVARHLARYHHTIWLLVTIYWRFLGSFMYKRKKVKTAPFHPSSHIGHKICLLLLWKIVRLSSLVKIEGVWLQSRITCRPIF